MENLYIKTYGCQMNVYDSEIIEKVVKPMGFKTVEDFKGADLVILNTCHIREKAAEKVYSELGRINAFANKQNKKILTIVAGCVAQAEGEQIIRRAKNVDIVVGPQSLHTLPELITKVKRKHGKEVKLDFDPIKKFDYLKEEDISKSQSKEEEKKYSAFVSIQEGCDKFCTFCVVPYTRGAECSRSAFDIKKEIEKLVASGTKEVNLLGQNVNAYHGKLSDEDSRECDLGDLIAYISQIDGLERIRYTTSHPKDMHESLYLAHATQKKLMPFLHLPVQAGSDKILKKMNRKYTAKEYLDIVARLRRLQPDIAFSSDFIVGFPGETDKDFEDTLEIVEKIKYAQCFSFKYSPRPGTPGAEYTQVAEDVKDKRLQKLQSILKLQQKQFNQSLVGSVLPKGEGAIWRTLKSLPLLNSLVGSYAS